MEITWKPPSAVVDKMSVYSDEEKALKVAPKAPKAPKKKVRKLTYTKQLALRLHLKQMQRLDNK